jgi:F0F1-type ATP synthase epsilon subunit
MDTSTFEFEIISPTSSQTIKVEWVTIESPTGSFFVGPHHTPLVSLIKKKSTLTYKNAAEKEATNVPIHEGFFRVTDNNKASLILLL